MDAAFEGAGTFSGKLYLARGSRYRRTTRGYGPFDDGGSLPLFAFHLPPAYHAGVDAALTGPPGPYGSKSYFFLGRSYARYDWVTERVDFQGTLGGDWRLPEPFASGIDAAINGTGAYAGKTFFFRGNQYLRYDWARGAVDPGYPLPLSAWNLPSPFVNGIDTVLPSAAGLLFVRGDSLVRYSWASNSTSPPENLSSAVPTLAGLEDAPTRRLILYLTIDPEDDRADQHRQNLQGLRAKLQLYAPSPNSPHLYADKWWARDVTASMLADPHVVAVVSGGSFTEWHLLVGPTYPGWRTWLDAYATMLWESDVPIFAICGSHQFLSGNRAGWDSVGHMGGLTIQLELTHGQAFIPNPRPREQGPTSVDLTLDPIFADLPNPASFVESHADEVRYASAEAENSIIASREPGPGRTYVQMLRYQLASQPDRPIYTSQFHPELSAWGDETSGDRLLKNFVDLAQDYWASR